MQVKIYYHHTDCGGVVYYANYLKYLEEARTEFLEENGFFINDMLKQDTLFVVARQEIDYKCPAVYGDILEVKAWVKDMSAVRMNFDSEIKNQKGQTIVKAMTVLVCVDSNLKPKAIPPELKTKIKWTP